MASALLAMVFVVVLHIGMVVLHLMWGWGLQPASWLWVFVFGLLGPLFSNTLMAKVMKDARKAMGSGEDR